MCRRFLLPLAALLSLVAGNVNAQFRHFGQDESRFQEELNERDFDALKQYLKDKRVSLIEEKGTDQLVISGDLRAEWRFLTERGRVEHTKIIHEKVNKHGELVVDNVTFKKESRSLRGGDATTLAGLPISKNDFDIEVNLRFDYVTKRTWAVAHIQYDNAAGVDDNDKLCAFDPEGYHGSGECDDVCLKKAFFGYNVFDDCCGRFDVELGRSNLYHAFDSRVQFLSRFDGILFTYTNKWDCVANFYWMLGGWVVDERVNQFAWATEIGFRNILDSGVDFKYSFIDWEKYGENRCHARNPFGFKFLNSQFTLAYTFEPEIICTKVKVYGAYLVNHAKGHWYNNNDRVETITKHKNGKITKKTVIPVYKYSDEEEVDGKTIHVTKAERKQENKRNGWKKTNGQNTAWYVGFQVGQVEQEGDWSFECQYQYVEAFAMPDNDMSGIGRGNVLKQSITAPGAEGNTNFKGWRFEGLYALTDDLTIDSIFEFSQAADTKIGGGHHYSHFEIETVYAF